MYTLAHLQRRRLSFYRFGKEKQNNSIRHALTYTYHSRLAFPSSFLCLCLAGDTLLKKKKKKDAMLETKLRQSPSEPFRRLT